MLRAIWCGLLISFCLGLPSLVDAGGEFYPRDGRFKQLSLAKDQWYFVDRGNWLIKAPDKWTHFMGSYALAEVIHEITRDKAWSGLVTISLGILKEYDDAFREGWSVRDLCMDIGGVASATIMPHNVKLLAYYREREVMFKLSLPVP
jgi:hypothetical protein